MVEVDPQARAGEAEVPKPAQHPLSEAGPCARAVGGDAVEAEASDGLEVGRVDRHEGGPGLSRGDGACAHEVGEESIAEAGEVACGAEHPGVAGHTAERPCVVVVDLSGAELRELRGDDVGAFLARGRLARAATRR